MFKVYTLTFYRWIEKRTDDEVFYWVKICSLVHGQIVVYGNVKEGFKSQQWNVQTFVLFKVLTRETPFITKGPWALFFGEPFSVSQLPKTKEFLLTSLLLFSLAFNFAIMVFKKLKFRTNSRRNSLNEILVGNFLNLLTLSKIILFVSVSLIFSILHAIAGWNDRAENGTRYGNYSPFGSDRSSRNVCPCVCLFGTNLSRALNHSVLRSLSRAIRQISFIHSFLGIWWWRLSWRQCYNFITFYQILHSGTKYVKSLLY